MLIDGLETYVERLMLLGADFSDNARVSPPAYILVDLDSPYCPITTVQTIYFSQMRSKQNRAPVGLYKVLDPNHRENGRAVFTLMNG
jgi:hypothetical protein